MAQGEFIEILSSDALASLKTANDEVTKLISNINKAGESMKAIKTPSQSDSAIKELNDNYREQEKIIKGLQKELTNLVKTKQTTSRLTTQEKLDTQILNVERKRELTLTSQVAGEYRKLSVAVAQASDKYQNLLVRGRLAGQTQRAFNIELRTAQNEFNKLQSKVLSADKAVDKWNRTGERTISLGRDLMSAFGIVGGVTMFAMLTKDIFEQTKEIQALDNALKLVTGTAQNFYNQQSFLNDIAERYGSNINDLTKQYTQFYVSAKDKLSGDKIQNIFESISKASASMGLSQQQSERAFLALNQMMSKGTIQAEELRGQLGEALPGAFGIMAKAVGVTEKELAKMMKAGELLASDVLPKFAKQLEITYGIENVTRIETLVTAQNRLANSWTAFVRSLNDSETGGISRFFKTILDGLTAITKGLTLLNESKKDTILRENKEINEQAFKQELDYLNGLESNQEESLKGSREFARKHLNERIELNKKLIEENKKLKEKFGDFFADKGALSKQYDDNKKAIEENKLVISRYAGQIRATYQYEANVLEEINRKKQEKIGLTGKELKSLQKLEEEREKNAFSRDISDLERQIEINNQKIGLETTYTKEKIELLEWNYKLEKEINEKTFLENLRLHKNSLELQAIDANNYRTKQEKNEKEHQEKLLKINNFKAFQDYREKYGRPTNDDETYGQDVTFMPTSDLDELIKGFEKLREDGIKKTKEEMEALKKATDEWIKSFQDGFFADAGLPTLLKVLNGEIKGFGENFTETFLAISEIAQEALAFMTQSSDAYFENQQYQLAQQRDVAIAFAGESATAREEIERQYDQRQRQLKRQQAQEQKKLALFNIAIDTAQAIVASFKTNPSGFLAGIIGAIGILQASIVASTPIPEFYKGTDNAPEGWAYTQEKGAEIITDKNGKVKSLGSNKGAELTYLNKGDKVFTAQESQMMFNNDLNNILVGNGIMMPKVEVNMDTQIITNEIKSLARTIANKESFTIVENDRGRKVYQRKQAETKELLNNVLTIKGYEV